MSGEENNVSWPKHPELLRRERVSTAYREHESECDYLVTEVEIGWSRDGDRDYVPPRFCPFCGGQVHDMTYQPPERLPSDEVNIEP